MICQKMIDFKYLFEQIISISIQFRNLYDELLLEYHNQQLNAGLEDDITHTLSSDNKIVISLIKQQQQYPTGTLPPKSTKKSSLKIILQ